MINLIEGINFGLIAQNLQGRILRKVMLKGIQEDILALPIHDAVTVELDQMSRACDATRRLGNQKLKGLTRVLKRSLAPRLPTKTSRDLL